MEQNDTLQLLKECDAGTKMAVYSIDEVLEKVQDTRLKELLNESRDHHAKLGNELHELLSSSQGSNTAGRKSNSHMSESSEPGPIAKGMSWMKTNMKLTMDDSDATIADLLTDGCNMGIKSLLKYLNQYQNADHASKDICKRLVKIEEGLRKDLREYL
jgi:hypothetical protein